MINSKPDRDRIRQRSAIKNAQRRADFKKMLLRRGILPSDWEKASFADLDYMIKEYDKTATGKRERASYEAKQPIEKSS